MNQYKYYDAKGHIYTPLKCEVEVEGIENINFCNEECFTVRLTEEEYKNLEFKEGKDAIDEIILYGVGIVLCTKHLEKDKE